ncbi:hypothetical protein HK104_002474 [Borealophlyctis nickersoniae]|nr:hypothetical protein HK104_002474 [Borealophlyctis nickersoniae]
MPVSPTSYAPAAHPNVFTFQIPTNNMNRPVHHSTSSRNNSAEKRANHNAIERARRESLNIRFQELASAIPSLANVRKPSKSVIVSKSIEFVYQVHRRNEIKDRALDNLRRRNAELHDEVNRLRSLLGMAQLSLEPDEDLEAELAAANAEASAAASAGAAAAAGGMARVGMEIEMTPSQYGSGPSPPNGSKGASPLSGIEEEEDGAMVGRGMQPVAQPGDGFGRSVDSLESPLLSDRNLEDEYPGGKGGRQVYPQAPSSYDPNTGFLHPPNQSMVAHSLQTPSDFQRYRQQQQQQQQAQAQSFYINTSPLLNHNQHPHADMQHSHINSPPTPQHPHQQSAAFDLSRRAFSYDESLLSSMHLMQNAVGSAAGGGGGSAGAHRYADAM